MTEAEHPEQLGAAALGIVSADVVHVRRLIQSETSYNAQFDGFLQGSIGAGLRGKGGGDIAVSLRSEGVAMTLS